MPLCLVSAAHGAFSLTPSNIILDVKKGKVSGWFELTHTGGAPAAIEFTLSERVLDINGVFRKDTLVETKDLLINPTQVILLPGEKKRVQVILTNPKNIKADKLYNINAKEIPLEGLKSNPDGPAVQMGIVFLMNYNSSVIVETGGRGRLTFVSSKEIGDGVIEVIAENKTNFRVKKDGRLMVNNKRINEFTGGQTSIMPGTARRFTFKHDKPLTAREFSYRHD